MTAATLNWANRSKSTLSGALGASDTTLTIAAPASGQDFPALAPFDLICGTEILLVTARSGNVFTVARAQQGTAAAAHAAGAIVSHGVTAGALSLLRDIEAHLIPGSAYHVAARLDTLLDDIYSLAYALKRNVTSGYGFGGYGRGGYGS